MNSATSLTNGLLSGALLQKMFIVTRTFLKCFSESGRIWLFEAIVSAIVRVEMNRHLVVALSPPDTNSGTILFLRPDTGQNS
jgi:hypothetical protein